MFFCTNRTRRSLPFFCDCGHIWTALTFPERYLASWYGNVPHATRAAAKAILDEGEDQAVVVREMPCAARGCLRPSHRLLGLGVAYVEFAMEKRGPSRLMFGPIFAERAKYPPLDEAATEAFRTFEVAQAFDGNPHEEECDAMAAWGLIHGLLTLSICGLLPMERIPSFVETILMTAVAPKSCRRRSQCNRSGQVARRRDDPRGLTSWLVGPGGRALS